MFVAATLAIVALFLIIICTPKAASSAPMPGATAGGYRNTGTAGSPTWAEMTSINSVAGFGDDWEFGDASTRATRAKLYDKTQVELGGTIRMLANPAATDYVAMLAASQSPSTVIDLMILHGKVTVEGAPGVRAGYKVKRIGNQEINGIIFDEFECKPHMSGASPVSPATVVMGSGSSPTLTTV